MTIDCPRCGGPCNADRPSGVTAIYRCADPDCVARRSGIMGKARDAIGSVSEAAEKRLP